MINTPPETWRGFSYEYYKYIILIKYIYITCDVAFECVEKLQYQMNRAERMALVATKRGQLALVALTVAICLCGS